MSIKIRNYKSNSGLTLKKAYLSVSQLTYIPKTSQLTFLVDVYADDTSSIPIEANVISGNFYVNEVEESSEFDYFDLESCIYSGILHKIEAVQDKTQEECEQHNISVNNWLDLWEIEYQKFDISESSEDDEEDIDEYLEAARILLEGE